MMSNGQRLTYCLANVAAVLTALWTALWLDLDRPYWAVFTVFIVSKPISGAVRAKGIYRFLGTLAGASMSIFLVPPLVQSPVLLSLAVSLWVAGCLFASLNDRTPRSYAFLLAGYSVAIIAFSAVNAPTSIFDVAVTRLEEISIGIICAAVAHSVFFPRSLGNVLRSKVDAAVKHSAAIVAKATRPNPESPSITDIAILGGSLTELHTLYTQVKFETSNVPRLPKLMTAILDRLATVLPNTSLICRSIAILEEKHMISAELRASLDEISTTAARIATGENTHPDSNQATSDALHDASLKIEFAEMGAVKALILLRVADMTTALIESQELAAELNGSGEVAHTRYAAENPGRRNLYRDQGLAVLSAVAAVAATLVACALWIETSWPEGGVAAQFAAIFSALFATMDRPSKVMGEAVAGILVALPIAAVYEFAILPSIDGFISLGLVLTPMLLLFSYLQTSEKLEGAALVLAVGFSGALALQESFAPDFASFMNANLAEICGPLIAIAMSLVFRTIDPVWNARRILESGRRALSDLGYSRWKDPKAWILQMVDRLGLAAARLSRTILPATDQDIMRDLRIGTNLEALLQTKDAFDQSIRNSIGVVGSLLGKLYAGPRGRRSDRSLAELQAGLTDLLNRISHAPPSRQRLEGAVALAGLMIDFDPLRLDTAGAS